MEAEIPASIETARKDQNPALDPIAVNEQIKKISESIEGTVVFQHPDFIDLSTLPFPEIVNILFDKAHKIAKKLGTDEDIPSRRIEAIAKGAVAYVTDSYPVRNLTLIEIDFYLTERLKATIVCEEDMREKNRKNIQMKGLTPSQQIERNRELVSAIDEVQEDEEAKKDIIRLVYQMLVFKRPANKLNRLEVGDLNKRESNDVVTNFLGYFMENHPDVDDQMRFVILSYLFRGLDQFGTNRLMHQLQKKDNTSYGYNLKSITQSYQRVKKLMKRDGEEYLQKFLQNPNVDNTNPEMSDSDDMKTEFAKNISDWDVILTKNGNLTARNRILLRLNKFIHFILKNHVILHLQKSDYENMVQAVSEKVLEKIIKVNIRKGKLTTYIGNSMVRMALRWFQNEGEVVRKPVHIHSSRKDLIGKKYVQLDKPVGEEGDALLADFMPQTITHETPESIAAENDISTKVQELIYSLPGRDGEILKRHIMLGHTLQEIGDDYGLTRERVRQLVLRTLFRLDRTNPMSKKARNQFREAQNIKDQISEGI